MPSLPSDGETTVRGMDSEPSTSERQLPAGRAAGQRVRLETILRTLIRDYPAGIGIVKEFIQNADDAGASKLRVMLDRRTHRGADLPSKLVGLMGPALLFESDQVFSDADLEAIRSIGAGTKQHDIARTGQFGLGFNTAYTVTDYPSFVTGDLLRCFDPFDDKVSQREGDHGTEWFLKDLWDSCPTWLQAFGLEPGTQQLQRTIFRLPLRTPTQATAERLRDQPFTPDEAASMLKDVEAFGAAMLLFLRNMRHLDIRETSENGQIREILNVQTTNEKEVERSRAELRISVSETRELLERWRSDPNTAPRKVYLHEFAVRGRLAQQERWLISQSFETEGAILDRAIDMLGYGQKTVPKVGVACKLDLRGSPEPVEGYLFCTLPLPGETGLSFHVNGFFDLDSSRRAPIQDRGTEEVNTRTAWNKTLLRHAVPTCAGRLFPELLSQAEDLEPSAFFRIWPDLRRGTQLEMGPGIVCELAACTSLRVRGSGNIRWVRPDQAKHPRENWPLSLVEALQSDGLEFIDPGLPEHVLDGLRHCKREPKVITWEHVKAILSSMGPFCGHHSESPLSSLREREHILQLLELFHEAPPEALVDLPLSLRTNGSLHAFSTESKVFDADFEVRQLVVHQQPNFFLDVEVSKKLKAHDVPGRIFYGPDRICDLLRWVYGKCTEAGYSDWTNSEDEVVELAWVERVLNFLAQHPPENPRNALQGLPLVLDQAQKLHPLYDEHSPCNPSTTLTPKEFEVLQMFGVQTVGGPESIRKALEYLLTRLKGAPLPTLAKAIAQRLLVGTDQAPVPEAWERLLDLLAKAHSVDSLPEATLKSLAELRIWPTQDGLWPVSDQRVFIPADFRSPSFGGDVQLLTLGDGKIRESLFTAMGARRFTLQQFVDQVFIQEFEELDDETRNTALDWLAAQRRLTEDMVAALREARIAPTSTGNWVTPSQVYDPDATETHALLGEGGPVLSCSQSSEPKMRKVLFKKLGMVREPRAKDLLLRIKDQATQGFTPEGHPRAGDSLKACFEHIVQRGEEFWNRKVDGHPLTEHLSKLAWLPAVVGDDPRVEYGVLFDANVRLYKAAELFARSEGFLVASQEPLSEFADQKGLLEKLGIRMETPLATARKHFEAVRDAFVSGHASDTCARKTAQRFYRLIGRREPPSRKVASLRQTMTRPEVIWDNEALIFRRAEHCFAEPVRYFLEFRAHVPGSGEIGAGMDLLGRRQVPDICDLVAYLNDLAAVSEGRPLRDEGQKSALHVLNELLTKLRTELNAPGDKWDGYQRVHVLDEACRLRQATKVLRDDAPWWAERIDRDLVALLDGRVGDELARFTGVRKISDVIKEELVVQPDEAREGSAPWTVCKQLSERLHSPEFEEGLRRLIYAKYEEAGVSLDTVFGLCFKPCAELTTVLVGAPLAPYRHFGKQQIIVYLSGDKVYIASESLDDALPDAAQAINRKLDQYVLQDLAPLEEILRVDVSKIEERLDRRRISRLPEAVEPPTQDCWTNNVGLCVQEPGAPEDFPASDSNPGGSLSESPQQGGEFASTSIQSQSFGTHGFSEPSASVRPRDGRTRFPSKHSSWVQRGHLVTHLPTPTTSDGAGTSSTFAGMSEEARKNALSKAREYELNSGVKQTCLMESPQDYPGFDLARLGGDGQVERVIAVEGVVGVWASGIALGSAQVHAGRELGDRYWVYVVEHADDLLRAQVHAIRSPISRSTAFQLDHGWRAYAERPSGGVSLPAVGKHVYRRERFLGVIDKVDGEPLDVSSVVVLSVREPDGALREMTWSRTLHRIVEEDDG